MAMSHDKCLQLIGERLGRWAVQLEAMEATPFLLIAVTHGDTPQIQVLGPSQPEWKGGMPRLKQQWSLAK